MTASLVETPTPFRLTLSHPTLGSAEVVFEKGATSTAGTIALNGASASALLDRVQSFEVTSAGPVWEGAAAAKVPAPPSNLTAQ